MSVYEQAYATPSRVLGVYRYLLNARGQRALRDELEELLMPDHLPLKDASLGPGDSHDDADEKKDAPKRDMAKRSIDETIAMRLAVADGEAVTLHPDLPAAASSPKESEATARKTICALLLSTTNTANHDLAKALAWYLAQDVYAAPSNWHDVDQNYRADAKALEMTNSRFGQLLHWSRFLGLAWAHAAPEKPGQKASRLALTPDPYWQIRWRLADIFAERNAAVLPLVVVVPELAAAVPVLEGGMFRNLLEGNVLATRDENQLSSATVHAWMRLQEEGTLKLAYRSDGYAYLFPVGDAEERFTEVAWMAGT